MPEKEKTPPIIVTTRVLGDVTIVDCSGPMDLTNSRDFDGCLRRLCTQNILVDFSKVLYIDSAVLGSLVACHVKIARNKGRFAIFAPNVTVRNLFTVSGVAEIFETFENEAAALKALEASNVKLICPICGHSCEPDEANPLAQSCKHSGCKTVLSMGLTNSSNGVQQIKSARIPTYADEYFEAVAGTPFRVLIVGRLNLFTSSKLDKLVNALPTRSVLFDLSRTTEISEEGREALLSFCRNTDDSECAFVSLTGLDPMLSALFAAREGVCEDEKAALAALSKQGAKTHTWLAPD